MVEVRVIKQRNFSTVSGLAFHYGLATLGPIANAGSQFLLSLQTLHGLDPQSFGSFSFLLIASQFSCGVWSALFCAPLPILVTKGTLTERAAMLRCLFSACGLSAVLAAAIFGGLGTALQMPALAIVLLAAYAGFALLRWFARQHAYLGGSAKRTVASDFTYSATILIGIVISHSTHDYTILTPICILLVGAIVSLGPFGVHYLKQQFLSFSYRSLLRYVDIWRSYSRWSLLGVASTEATGNAHAYLITSFVGPAGLAPLSASALLIRPINVTMMALLDFERPRLTALVQARDLAAARRSLHLFRLVLIAAWLATALAALALMITNPGLIFPPRYSAEYLAQAGAIWMVIALVRSVRIPESALLQAAGMFRPLAWASIVSSGVSVGVVMVLLIIYGPLVSLFGILIGETTYAIWIHRQARLWSCAYEAAEESTSTAEKGM